METQKEMKAPVDTKSKNSVVWEFVAWNEMNMNPAEFETKYKLLLAQINDNKLNSWGEVLHAAGVMLHYSRLKIIPDSEEEIIEIFRKKITEYAATSDFEPLSDAVLITGGFGGHVIRQFARLKAAGIPDSILIEQDSKRAYSLKKKFLEYVKNIDKEKKLSELCQEITINSTKGKFSTLPVFASLDEKEREKFFKSVMTHKVGTIVAFVTALARRYAKGADNGSVVTYLMSEREFIESFNAYAEKKLQEEEPRFNPRIEKYQYVIEWLIPIINRFNRSKTNKH